MKAVLAVLGFALLLPCAAIAQVRVDLPQVQVDVAQVQKELGEVTASLKAADKQTVALNRRLIAASVAYNKCANHQIRDRWRQYERDVEAMRAKIEAARRAVSQFRSALEEKHIEMIGAQKYWHWITPMYIRRIELELVPWIETYNADMEVYIDVFDTFNRSCVTGDVKGYVDNLGPVMEKLRNAAEAALGLVQKAREAIKGI